MYQDENIDIKSSAIQSFSSEMFSSLKYALLKCDDMERSFSAHKHIVINRCYNLIETNVNIKILLGFSNNIQVIYFFIVNIVIYWYNNLFIKNVLYL